MYASVPPEGLIAIQSVHETSKRDQFLMKLRGEFEAIRSNLMNREPVPLLDICVRELLREEQLLSWSKKLKILLQFLLLMLLKGDLKAVEI